MREVLTRRFRHYLEGDEKFSALPDLPLFDAERCNHVSPTAFPGFSDPPPVSSRTSSSALSLIMRLRM